MSSTFNLLTAGGARFDKSRFKADMELFSSVSSASPLSHLPASPPLVKSLTKPTVDADAQKSNKGKGKARADPSLPSSLNIFSDAQLHRPSSSKPALPSDEEDEEMEEELAAPPKQKINISGPEPLPSSLSPELESLTTHSHSPLPDTAATPLLAALRGAKVQSLWGVQTAVGGALLADKDVICIAPTGSGKTLAYVLPTLVRLVHPARTLRRTTAAEKSKKGKKVKEEEQGNGIRAVVVVPTHDLAIQIHEVCRAVMVGRTWRCLVLSKATQKAGCESAPGAKYVRKMEGEDDDDDEAGEQEAEEMQGTPLGLDLLIATPERLHHLLENDQLSLKDTRHLILDESDRLLSPDFLPQVKPIVAACTHPSVQKCLLSATMPPMAEKLARTWMRHGGVRVVVGVKDSAVTTVAQSLLYTATEQGKLLALRNLIAEGGLPYPSLVFTQSIERAEELHKTLALEGLRVGMVHGGRSKAARDEAVVKFRDGELWVLVVTEVLARGMDFRGVKVVVNYDFPQTLQSYIHRIGRTGRAGRPGKSITFVNTEDSPYLRTIARVLEKSGCKVPPYMLDLPKVSKDVKKRLAKAPVKRSRVGGGGRDVAKEDARKRRDIVKASRRRRREVEGGPPAASGDDSGEE